MNGNVERHQMRQHVLESVRALAQPRALMEIFLNDHADHRGEQERVAAGLHLKMNVREFRGLGAARIDHDQAAVRISRDFTQGCAGARNAVREPRVFADEQPHLAVFEVAARIAADHLVCDPEFAGLLLGKRTRTMHRSKECARRATVDVGQVVTLAPAAVIEDRFAAVRVADRGEACSDFADRRVPVDLLECAVFAPAQRLRQTMRAVLVVVEARRLLAHVASGNRVRVVAVHFDKLASILAAKPNFNAAVALAQDASGRLPLGHVLSWCGLTVSRGGASYSVQLPRESWCLW